MTLTPAASLAVPTSWRCGGRELLLAQALEFLFGRLELGQGGGDPVREQPGGNLEHLGELGDEGALGGEVPEGVHADEGLDAAVSRTDGLFAEQGQAADQRGVLDVGAAAEFAGPGAVDLHDADFVAVVLAEQRHGAERLGLGERP